MNKFKISHLKAMKKADLFSLCLKEFGNDTASVYSHYTKSEMVDDLMTVTTPDTTATPDETAEATNAELDPIQFELPFAGFYQSLHADRPYDSMDELMNAGADKFTDEQADDLWRAFHKEFDYKTFMQKTSNYYAYWLLCQCLDINTAETLVNVTLEQPREYNFTNDKIYVDLKDRPKQLTLEYFQANDLIEPLMWFIKERYTSRSGFISFIEPNPDDMEMVFTQPHYLDCVAYVWVCHALELDPYDGYSINASELDSKFIEYMFEQGNYDELFWECLPSDVAEYLNDIEL